MEPKLIHPVNVCIKNIDKQNTTYDEDFDEPIVSGLVYEEDKWYKAQVKIGNMSRMKSNVSGFDLQGDGYLLMHRDDAEIINMKAKITNIDGRTVEYYVIEKTPAAHYQSGKFVMVLFESTVTGDQ